MLLRPLDPWCGVVVDYEDTRVFVDVTDLKEPYLKRADAVIVTHPHRDHYGGVPKIDFGKLRTDDVTAALLGMEDPFEPIRSSFEVGLLDARAYPVNHMCPEAHAVLLSGDARVLITGDWCALGEHPPLWERVDEVDAIVTECTRACSAYPDDPEAAKSRVQRLLELHRDDRTVLLLTHVNPLIGVASEVETLHVPEDDPIVKAVDAGAHEGTDLERVRRPEYPLVVSEVETLERLPRKPRVLITERWFLYRDRERMRELLGTVPFPLRRVRDRAASAAELVRLVEELEPEYLVLRHGSFDGARKLKERLRRLGLDVRVEVWIRRRGGNLKLP
ncbi:MBL fold metallo-hydrolase [Methanopyrus sp.]